MLLYDAAAAVRLNAILRTHSKLLHSDCSITNSILNTERSVSLVE
jgi:hypothetical protein